MKQNKTQENQLKIWQWVSVDCKDNIYYREVKWYNNMKLFNWTKVCICNSFSINKSIHDSEIIHSNRSRLWFKLSVVLSLTSYHFSIWTEIIQKLFKFINALLLNLFYISIILIWTYWINCNWQWVKPLSCLEQS